MSPPVPHLITIIVKSTLAAQMRALVAGRPAPRLEFPPALADSLPRRDGRHDVTPAAEEYRRPSRTEGAGTDITVLSAEVQASVLRSFAQFKA